MPKQSKLGRPSRRSVADKSKRQPPTKAAEQARPDEGARCTMCGKRYSRQARNFSVVQSSFWKGNLGYVPICVKCVDQLYEYYEAKLGSPASAVRRLCMMFDIYWDGDVFKMINLVNGRSVMKSYISRVNLIRFHGKTYDDTIEAESTLVVKDIVQDEDDGVKTEVPQAVKDFWGVGLSDDMYRDLQARYEIWLSKYPEGTEFEPGEEALLRQICNLELDINHARMNGEKTERMAAQLDNIIGSLKMKPSQKRDNETGYIPFGLEILDAEAEDPIPEPDDKYKDVDHVQEYFATWVLGGLSAMTGMENKYRELFGDAYDKLIERYTVQKPKADNDEEDEVSAIDFFRNKAHGSSQKEDA